MISINDIGSQFINNQRLRAINKLIESDVSLMSFYSLAGSSVAMLFASMPKQSKPVLIIGDGLDDAGYLYHDISRMLGEDAVLMFPSGYKRDIKYGPVDAPSQILRTEVLNRWYSDNAPRYVVTYPDALAERVASREAISRHTLHLKVGCSVDLVETIKWLRNNGFVEVDYVYEPGHFASRGSILDIFGYSNEYPFRLDFFGDEVDSIRRFDISSQLSSERPTEVEIIPNLNHSDMEKVSLVRFAGEATCWFYDAEYVFKRVNDLRRRLLGEMEDPSKIDTLVTSRNTLLADMAACRVCLQRDNITERVADVAITFATSPQPKFNKNFEVLADDISDSMLKGYRTYILSENRAQIERLDNIFHQMGRRNIEFDAIAVTLHEGFVDNGLKLCLYTDHQIFDRYRRYRINGEIKRDEQMTVAELNALKMGDYVVHIDHGVGRFGGLVKINENGKLHEAIKLVYKDNDVLFVNVHSLHRISRYKSGEGEPPKIYKLGNGAWQKLKTATKKAVKDISRELIALYAKRKASKGFAFSADSYLQNEMEASFQWEETADQQTAIAAVKKDMESDQPMDRLVCGDVGFGKTEVAIRAAFKAVQEGKQVVYLVPTTILAQQHYNTFVQRMKDFPVRIDLLCRFRSPSEQKKTVEDLRKGLVDIVVGTHRVLSKDVTLKDLGLLIIDEEQRFGVTHKEKIKKMKEQVDVLTLTATPIPRTLHMSLIGIRDMSVLEEAPGERQPIQTYVMEYNEELVREAIVRELSRDGQVYYVYNRINNIAEVAATLQKLVPEAVVAFAHGQMQERELERIMYDFINGEIDVLVSTTIIETGLDISNVNTMIIHDSDTLGLSQLYQLRGRVGRSNRTAYAFLMYKRDKMLREVAEKRLAAIKEFTDLGSGFKIAMRDLEIRGAGNLLGTRQHGHMQAVGYDLYCKMLNEAVKKQKGISTIEDFTTTVDLDVDAYIPPSYIVNEIQKLDIYKRIAGLESQTECDDMRDELLDRFGELPVAVVNLLRISMIRVRAHKLYITDVKGKNSEIVFSLKADAKIRAERIPELLKAVPKLNFNYKMLQFNKRYPKCGVVEKDAQTLLSLTEELLTEMERFLLSQEV